MQQSTGETKNDSVERVFCAANQNIFICDVGVINQDTLK